MEKYKKVRLDVKHNFDTRTSKHFLNSIETVFHCHHYTALYTQLAMDADETDLLTQTAAESFYDMLKNYLDKHDDFNLNEKIELIISYYSLIGLGKMQLQYLGNNSGKAILHFSHIDKGWIHKWGNSNRPVNFITCGYIKAMFAIINEKPVHYYNVVEKKSIAMGDKESEFKIFV